MKPVYRSKLQVVLPSLFLLAQALAVPALASGPSAAAQAAAESGNRFGFKLFQAVLNAKPTDNVLVSPLSASIALSMALNGAEGQTQAQLAQALGVEGQDLARVNENASALMAELVSGRTDEKVRIANSLWADRKFEFMPSFLSAVGPAYSARVSNLDFRTPEALGTINSWVSDKTEKMIPKLLQSLSPEPVALLINALYFQGTWSHPFFETRQGPTPFAAADGTTVPVQQMMIAGNDGYVETQDLKMLSLAFRGRTDDEFGRAGEYRLDLILPNSGVSMSQIVNQTLDGVRYAELVRELRPEHVVGQVPRFRFETLTKLKPMLQQLGVTRAFTTQAELDSLGRADGKLYVEDVVQGTAIEMDENGLKAAAATAVIIASRSAVLNYKTFVADHPFLVVLRHAPTGSVLFAGQVAKPAWH